MHRPDIVFDLYHQVRADLEPLAHLQVDAAAADVNNRTH
jgi:hypothetical protein